MLRLDCYGLDCYCREISGGASIVKKNLIHFVKNFTRIGFLLKGAEFLQGVFQEFEFLIFFCLYTRILGGILPNLNFCL